MFTLDIKSDLKQESPWEKTYTWSTNFAESKKLDIQSHGGHSISFIANKGSESFGGSGKWPVRIFQ